MSKPRLLDLFCCAGGCSLGYSQAGFEVVGVDIGPQKWYPFEFVLGDALEYAAAHGREFDAIHASPPCQAYTVLKNMPNHRTDHPDLLGPTRDLLRSIGKPYVIENVPGSPIEADLMLCATMFGLRTPCGAELRRHRYFECPWLGFEQQGSMQCRHGSGPTISVHGDHPRDGTIAKLNAALEMSRQRERNPDLGRKRTVSVTGHTPQNTPSDKRLRETFSVEYARIAMGIDAPWPMKALSQAIPPPYCKWIGERLIRIV